MLSDLIAVVGSAVAEGSSKGEIITVVTITGLIVVFSALIFLTLLFRVYGLIIDKTGKKSAKKNSQTKAEAVETPKAQASAPAAPVVADGISGEVIAAIAAAVACMDDSGKRYTVRSVRRSAGNGRSAWSMAGLMENTRPF